MELYSCVELGNNSIKVAVMSYKDNKFYLLAKEEKKTMGIKRGNVVNSKDASKDLNEALTNIEKKLNVSIKKVIICISPLDIVYDMISSSISVYSDTITGYDISTLVRKAAEDNYKKDYEIITLTPVGFKLDNGMIIDDPKGKESTTLSSKIVATYIEKDKLLNILNVFNLCDLNVIDITFKPVADYYEVRNKDLDNKVGAIINIGEDATSVSIYNKGIMIKNSYVGVGSSHIDHDYSYKFKIDLKEARRLKETFATASTNHADKNDTVEVINENEEKITISQYELAEITENKVVELLELAKKEIKNLTNREISYIIILGGLSEIASFSYIVDKVYGTKASLYNSTTMGIRHNKYTSVVGAIKYFKDKIDLRDMNVSMFEDASIEKITSNDYEDNKIVIDEMFEQFIN